MAKTPVKRVKAGTSKLSAGDKRKAFIEAFLSNGGNASQAAVEAGFSPHTASRQGGRLLKDVRVLSELRQRQGALARKYELTTEAVIRSISQEMHFDPAKIYNADGSLKSVLEMDEDTRMALTSIECEQIGGKDGKGGQVVVVRKYKWATKHQAREQAMKHLGMFEADNLQKSALADLPREMVKAIVERLRQINERQL